MTYEALISMIQDFGYAALFFALWLGIVGMPIPDEVIVMAGGAVTNGGLLKPVPAFILTYVGVASGLSLGYILGRYVGAPILEKIRRKKKMGKFLDRSEKLVEKYGDYALIFSYFLPIVRHIIPYIVGSNKMTFGRYAMISYPTGFIWTLLFFMLGHFLGDHVESIGTLIYQYGLKVVSISLLVIIVFTLIKLNKKSHG